MKKPTHANSRKLNLSTETVRSLDRAALDQIAGGRRVAVTTLPTCVSCDPGPTG
ncbi:MAG: hypothetical protein K8W52_45570 [Deltaproteobacteria bacterium]|nr:hypothetical protein [Deltaproteobacteria bacterium]